MGTSKVSLGSSLPEETILSNHMCQKENSPQHSHVAELVPTAQGQLRAMAYQAMWAPSETHRCHSCLRIEAIKGTKGTLSFLYLLLISFFTSYFLDTSTSALPSFLFHLFSCLLSPFRLLLPCSYELLPPFVPLDKVTHNPSIALFFSGLHKTQKLCGPRRSLRSVV